MSSVLGGRLPAGAPLPGRAMQGALEQPEAERRLSTLELHDPVTGLANPPLFQEMLDNGLARARRDDSGVAVLLIFLGGLAAATAELGREAGDRILRTIAIRVRDRLRAADTTARLGGAELAVLMEAVMDPEDARKVADKLIRTIAAPMSLNGSAVQLSTSIGISLFPASATSAEGMIRAAGRALDAAKGNGGDRMLLG